MPGRYTGRGLWKGVRFGIFSHTSLAREWVVCYNTKVVTKNHACRFGGGAWMGSGLGRASCGERVFREKGLSRVAAGMRDHDADPAQGAGYVSVRSCGRIQPMEVRT